MQVKEVKVCFVSGGRAYSFDVNNVYVHMNDKVIVETVRGLEMGTVCSKVTTKQDTDFQEPLKKVLRVATEEDIKQKEVNKQKEKEIKTFCENCVKKLNLDMKLLGAELNFEGTKVIINFTSNARVDFRELVKQLAAKYKMRVELRQLDIREETKVVGGLGPCGRECCCASFLSDATHSSIKMAKVQGLSLNPSSIGGLCGKLKCCLAYENEHYMETFKLMPKLNTEILTPDGKGLVVYNDLLKRVVSVKFIGEDGSQSIKEYSLEVLKNL